LECGGRGPSQARRHRLSPVRRLKPQHDAKAVSTSCTRKLASDSATALQVFPGLAPSLTLTKQGIEHPTTNAQQPTPKEKRREPAICQNLRIHRRSGFSDFGFGISLGVWVLGYLGISALRQQAAPVTCSEPSSCVELNDPGVRTHRHALALDRSINSDTIPT